MLLLNRRLAQPEQTRLGVIFAERRAALADFFAVDALGEGLKAAAFGRWRRLARPVVVNGVGLVVGRIGVNVHPVHPVALEIVIRAGWTVDGDFMEVRPTQAANLRVGVREEAPLQQRIVAEINARYDMPGMKGRLFVFGKEVVRIAVEDHLANP